MGIVALDEIAEGMIVDADVRDMKNRLLLKHGNVITSKHIRIFKTWGVSSIVVRDESEPTSTGATNENTKEKCKYSVNPFS